MLCVYVRPAVAEDIYVGKSPEWLRNRHMIVFLQVHGGANEGDGVGIFSKSARDSASPPQPRGLVSGMYFPGTLKVRDLLC